MLGTQSPWMERGAQHIDDMTCGRRGKSAEMSAETEADVLKHVQDCRTTNSVSILYRVSTLTTYSLVDTVCQNRFTHGSLCDLLPCSGKQDCAHRGMQAWPYIGTLIKSATQACEIRTHNVLYC